jgi:predicted peptidase
VIVKVVEELIRQRQIDETRIYLMGASSGAFATYVTAARNPGRFAAVAGVCGGFEKGVAAALAKTPALLFNAVKDRRIPIEKVRASIKALEAAGGVVKVVETPGGHGGYRDRATYELLFDWFDAHRLAAKPAAGGSREPE